MKHLAVLIVSPSKIIESGLLSMLKSLGNDTISVLTSNADNIISNVSRHQPDIIIADALTLSRKVTDDLRQAAYTPSPYIIGLYHSALPDEVTMRYDDTLSIYAGCDQLKNLIARHIETTRRKSEDNMKELSPREKEVVVGIVKGLSNKEIAANINVSVNTVMTHRRNIAAKLQIHSPAGLTIYAIVSKIVNIEDIKI